MSRKRHSCGIGAIGGLTLTRCYRGEYDANDAIYFETDDQRFVMCHDQDCCESVSIEDICGDLSDLVGSEILHASEDSNGSSNDDDDHETWTFYNIRTNKGSVTIRWYGTSNGYYSESADVHELDM